MNLFISNFVAPRITILIFHFTKIVLQFASEDYIYIYFPGNKIIRLTVQNFRGSFYFSILSVPQWQVFFGLISRDRRFRGGNRLYFIRPTELIAVTPLPPLHRIVHRSIRIFVFQFFFPPHDSYFFPHLITG